MRSLLEDINADYAMDSEIARVYKSDFKLFEATAKEWTEKYAMWTYIYI